MENILTVKDLSKTYKNGRKALDHLNFQVMVTPISWTLYIVSWPLASSFLLLTVLAYFLPTHLLRNLNLS
ncbi:hypothetical protein, partial [Aerococcus tenax]|uniref:hypothetical protein n=1 Tax=Aerococcus tenax TaxID=3078812 RepID=UPI001CD6FFE2